MANNRIYLECTGCEKADLFYFAKRMRDGYYGAPNSDKMCAWFDKHKYCGGTEDHFRLYYECTPNYDAGGLGALLTGKINPVPGTIR
jgi:hypothetical protein